MIEGREGTFFPDPTIALFAEPVNNKKVFLYNPSDAYLGHDMRQIAFVPVPKEVSLAFVPSTQDRFAGGQELFKSVADKHDFTGQYHKMSTDQFQDCLVENQFPAMGLRYEEYRLLKYLGSHGWQAFLETLHATGVLISEIRQVLRDYMPKYKVIEGPRVRSADCQKLNLKYCFYAAVASCDPDMVKALNSAYRRWSIVDRAENSCLLQFEFSELPTDFRLPTGVEGRIVGPVLANS